MRTSYPKAMQTILFAWICAAAMVAVAKAEAPIAGEWTLIRMFGSTIPDVAEPVLRISPDGALAASAGCNRFNARIQLVSPEQLRVSSPSVETTRACRFEVDETERGMMERLLLVRYIKINVDIAILENESREPLLELSRRK